MTLEPQITNTRLFREFLDKTEQIGALQRLLVMQGSSTLAEQLGRLELALRGVREGLEEWSRHRCPRSVSLLVYELLADLVETLHEVVDLFPVLGDVSLVE